VLLVAARGGSDPSGAVVEVGRSLSRHHSELDDLVQALLVTGAGGVVLASVGGFWLAGRALQPTRDAMVRQRQFVADASHELRTPLTLIRASAEAIQGGSAGKLDAEDRESLSDIVSESDRMAGLVDELLTLARLEEGRLELRSERTSGGDLVATALREAEVLAKGKDLSIRLEASEPVELHCDPARISQVLRILVDNAIRHTPAGGSITIGVRPAGGEAEFWVQDTGPGIAPEHLERIFERFYRADEPRSRQAGGSGLGLSIARRIVEAHGGKIEARSGEGQAGARIVFQIPLRG
jgi:signal transduction histidine kinase